MKRSILPLVVILLVLVLDQVLKVYIKTNFHLYQDVAVLGLDWFRLHFVENEGMAFGMTWGGDMGKLALTLFRIVAVSFIGYYLIYLIKGPKGMYVPMGLLVSIALVFAGAMGNIIDSVFYGMLFSESGRFAVAEYMPEGGGYAGIFYGKVVDMLHFPLLSGHYPDWVPQLGGRSFTFFSPIFNLADAAITVGVASVLIFYRGFFAQRPIEEGPGAPASDSELMDRSIEPAAPPAGSTSIGSTGAGSSETSIEPPDQHLDT